FAETGAKDRWDGCAVLPATWLKPGANEPGSAAGGCESQKLSRVSGEKRGSSRDTFAKTQSYLRARMGSTRAALRAGRERATAATARRKNVASAMLTGSCGVTPKSRLALSSMPIHAAEIKRVAA